MKTRIAILICAFLLTACCSNRPQVIDQARLEHDILTDIVVITDVNYDKDEEPIVDLYITNPHNYKLNVYQVGGNK